ncbi:chorismate mutase [Actinospica robiniae]|uniref:chorismate mutase n=1 Tax=Actinospica robiniae TaxID=304901 RepID=UPI00040A7C2E|nr:chorismate mutase [Actinospica robiniae]
MSEQSEPTEDDRSGQPRAGVGHERQAPEGVAGELRLLRDSIDNLDAALVFVLAERFKCTQKVGQLKARHELPPADPEREAQQIRRLRRLAEESQLEPQFAEKFLNFIVEEVVRHHKLIAAAASPQGPAD